MDQQQHREHLERMAELFNAERNDPFERRFVVASVPRDRSQDAIQTQRMPVFA